MARLFQAAFLAFLLSTAALCQSVSSTVNGAIVDSTGAAIAGAACKLTHQSTGAPFTATSGADGLFTFNTVSAGVYTLSVHISGFKALEVKDVSVTSREIRSLGNLVL